jgi:carboxyl-terminal processing protease
VLPASNRGAGQALNFPDVCKTPAPPAPFVPAPYPDIGMNMQAAPFSPFVSVGFVPATNMGTLKVMTSGDEVGAMGGLVTGMIKGPGKLTMGNPIVFVTGLPAENLGLPTSGNAMNAPVGAQIVPSVINVTYTYRHGPLSGAALPVALDAESVRALHDVAAGEGEAAVPASVTARWLDDGVACLGIALFSSHTDREVFNALRRLGFDDIQELELDLRGNPGGDTDAALRLASAFLPRGTVMLLERDGDGDEEPIVARGEQSYRWPLRVRIDGATASAAELLTAALQHPSRATVFGQPSYGKATAQRAIRWPDGALRYVTVSQFLLPDGGPIDGCGVTPDEIVGFEDEQP